MLGPRRVWKWDWHGNRVAADLYAVYQVAADAGRRSLHWWSDLASELADEGNDEFQSFDEFVRRGPAVRCPPWARAEVRGFIAKDRQARERAENAVHEVYLDLGPGGAMAHGLGDLLGCNRTARTRARALQKIRREIPKYVAWLAAMGEWEVVPRPVRIVVAEAVADQNPWEAGGTNALFTAEREPATDGDIELCFRRMSGNRAQTRWLVKDVPGRVLAARPRGEPRSIADTLSHIADAELWYLSRIGREAKAAARRLPRDPMERLEAARRAVLPMLNSLTPRERSGLFVPTKWCSPRQRRVGEPWTARKVLRRILEHERQHAAYIARLLAVRA